MGQTTDNMKSSKTPAADKKDNNSFLGLIPSRKKTTSEPVEKTAETLKDMIDLAVEKTERLIAVKEAEVVAEKGRETINSIKLACLRSIQNRLDEIVDQMHIVANVK